MNIFQRIFVFLFYTIGTLLIAVPFFMAAIVTIIAYSIIVIFSDILVALGLKKR